jgi:cytochrome P450
VCAERDQLDEMLRDAVRAAYEGEHTLFEERAHERSIVFHIARHLAARVEALLPGWSVDVDYDRWHRGDIEGVKKRLHWRRVERGNTARAEDHDVYPDIIVHRRSEPSVLNDLLVIEVKKEESDGHEDDREKLRAFMGNPFCYQHAAFVILPRDGGFPCWQWITPPGVPVTIEPSAPLRRPVS